jgi:hypothetical protein
LGCLWRRSVPQTQVRGTLRLLAAQEMPTRHKQICQRAGHHQAVGRSAVLRGTSHAAAQASPAIPSTPKAQRQEEFTMTQLSAGSATMVPIPAPCAMIAVGNVRNSLGKPFVSRMQRHRRHAQEIGAEADHSVVRIEAVAYGFLVARQQPEIGRMVGWEMRPLPCAALTAVSRLRSFRSGTFLSDASQVQAEPMIRRLLAGGRWTRTFSTAARKPWIS